MVGPSINACNCQGPFRSNAAGSAEGRNCRWVAGSESERSEIGGFDDEFSASIGWMYRSKSHIAPDIAASYHSLTGSNSPLPSDELANQTYSVVINDLGNDGDLASGRSIVDKDDSANFDESLESGWLLRLYRLVWVCLRRGDRGIVGRPPARCQAESKSQVTSLESSLSYPSALVSSFQSCAHRHCPLDSSLVDVLIFFQSILDLPFLTSISLPPDSTVTDSDTA